MKKYKPLDLNYHAKYVINRKLDKRVIKQREIYQNGKTIMLDYISGSTCVDLLNEAFGHMWSFEVEREWKEEAVPHFKKIYNNNLNFPEDQIVLNEKGERGIYIEQSPILWCKGVLTVYIKDEETGELICIKKTGFGSTAITGNQSSQSNNGYKGAQTDALKKAASQLGIANELYRDKDEQAVYNEYYMEALEQDLDEDEVQAISEIEKLAGNFEEPNKVINYYADKVGNSTFKSLKLFPLNYLKIIINKIKEQL